MRIQLYDKFHSLLKRGTLAREKWPSLKPIYIITWNYMRFFRLWVLLTFLVNSSELGAGRQWEIPMSSGLLPRTNNISFDWSHSGSPTRNSHHQHRKRAECRYKIHSPSKLLCFSLLSLLRRLPAPLSGQFDISDHQVSVIEILMRFYVVDLVEKQWTCWQLLREVRGDLFVCYSISICTCLSKTNSSWIVCDRRNEVWGVQMVVAVWVAFATRSNELYHFYTGLRGLTVASENSTENIL